MATVTTTNASIANRTAESLASGFDSYEPLAGVIFNSRTPKRKAEIFTISAQDSSFNAVGEADNFPSVDIEEVGTDTLTQLAYKKKLVISQMMKNFDSEGQLMEEAMRLGLHARISIDQLHADVLNNGFTSETCWDGNSLFNNSHNIGSTTLTQDNLVSGALTDSTLNDAVVALRDLVDHNDAAMPLLPRFLVVPTALEKKARELIDSGLDPESANNTINTHRSRGIQVVVWELLTSSTAWFLIADKAFHRLTSLVSQPLIVETRNRLYTESGSDEVRAEFHLVAGAPDYLGLIGSTGS